MKFTISSFLGLAAVAAAAQNSTVAGPFAVSNGTVAGPVYTTEVVTSFTTYCPAATVLTVNSKVSVHCCSMLRQNLSLTNI